MVVIDLLQRLSKMWMNLPFGPVLLFNSITSVVEIFHVEPGDESIDNSKHEERQQHRVTLYEAWWRCVDV